MKTLFVTRTRMATLSLALALGFSGSVMAAPTVSTFAGDTTVALSSEFTGALASLNVAVSPVFPARIGSKGAKFPIPAGEVDLGTVKGEIVHEGGLTLTAGETKVTLSSYVIDTTGEKPVLTGLVKLNDSVVARLPLFDLALTSDPQVSNRGFYGSLRISDVAVTLNAGAAAALNDIFKVDAFAGGLPIGTAKVRSFFFEPDRINH